MFLLVKVQKECMNSCRQPAGALSIPVVDLVEFILNCGVQFELLLYVKHQQECTESSVSC